VLTNLRAVATAAPPKMNGAVLAIPASACAIRKERGRAPAKARLRGPEAKSGPRIPAAAAPAGGPSGIRPAAPSGAWRARLAIGAAGPRDEAGKPRLAPTPASRPGAARAASRRAGRPEGSESPGWTAPRMETPRSETPRSESPRWSTGGGRSESPGWTAPRMETPRSETPRGESPRWSTGGGRSEGGGDVRITPAPRSEPYRAEPSGGGERRSSPRGERGNQFVPMSRGGWSTAGEPAAAGSSFDSRAAGSAISVRPRSAEGRADSWRGNVADVSPRWSTGGGGFDGVRVSPAPRSASPSGWEGRSAPRSDRTVPYAPLTRGGWSTGSGAAEAPSWNSPRTESPAAVSPRWSGGSGGVVDLSPRTAPRSEAGGSWSTGGGRTGWAADGFGGGRSAPAVIAPRSAPSYGGPAGGYGGAVHSAPSFGGSPSGSFGGGMRSSPGFGGGSSGGIGGGMRGSPGFGGGSSGGIGGGMRGSPGFGGRSSGGASVGGGGGMRGGRAR